MNLLYTRFKRKKQAKTSLRIIEKVLLGTIWILKKKQFKKVSRKYGINLQIKQSITFILAN